MIMQAERDFQVTVGRLGRCDFKPGWYCYTGSAFGPGGLAARCARHARREKTLRWHLDYLSPYLRFVAVWYALGPERYEHDWAMALATWVGVRPAWPGFGASDCRCATHLWYRSRRPRLPGFRRLVANAAIADISLEA